jgi:ATP-dependent DNA ligase
MPDSRKPATFVEPMKCLSVSKLPDGSQWLWELKWDGYRAVAVKGSTVKLYSRNHKSLDKKFPYICEALHELPSETVVDGEIVALDDTGRPNFNLLQNFVSEAGRIGYFIFDVLHHKGRDVTGLTLIERRQVTNLNETLLRVTDILNGLEGWKKNEVSPESWEKVLALSERIKKLAADILDQIEKLEPKLQVKPPS